jgi:hypothetical protein
MNKQAKENYQNLWNEFIEVLPTLVKNGAAGSAKGYTRKLNGFFTDISKTTDIVDKDGMMPDDDKVNNPSHYQSLYKDGIDCITAMRHAFGDDVVAAFCKCNAMKYIWRESSKGGNESIQKAIWYLNKYLELNK